MSDTRPCTCAPDERPYPCQHKYALGECRKQYIRVLRSEVNKLQNDLMFAHNSLAQMMIRQSLSTGHGDTIANLINELELQVEESNKRVGVFRLLVAACNRLQSEAEEYEFDDGMGRGAQLDYWYEFDNALERAKEELS